MIVVGKIIETKENFKHTKRDCCMKKIVDQALKIDLHIHSKCSSIKDGDKVKDNTESNLDILVEKLTACGIGMCAITDHDTFSYSMYKALKKYENEEGILKKVLPGVEFSVNFDGKKVIHIVTIFNDMDDEKIKKMDEILINGNGKKLFDKKSQSFSRENYFALLKEIDTDFIMIAHQKKTPTSSQRAKNADVMSLGRETFNELLFMEYFDAYEFRNRDNEVFNKQYAIDMDSIDKLRFITGSDCHNWNYYPHSNENIEEICFTYIKALPTFKGLVMAITDHHRINYTGSFFGQGKFLPEMRFNLNGNEVVIPLSRGINVLIGDNSIGKSLILHDLTEGRELQTRSPLRKGYENYKKKKKLTIESHIDELDMFKFNYQGQIREIFDDPDMRADKYLADYFPDDINSEKYREIIDKELNRFYDAINKKFDYDDKVNSLHTLKILEEEPSDSELLIGGTIKTIVTTDIQKLVSDLEKVITLLLDDVCSNPELKDKDVKRIKSEIEYLQLIQEQYQKELDNKKRERIKVNAYNTALKKYKEKYNERQTDEYNLFNAYVEDRKSLIDEIVLLVNEKRNIGEFKFSIEDEDIVPETNPIDTYVFVSKIGIEKIGLGYLDELCKEVLKRDKHIDVQSITKEALKKSISRFPPDTDDALEGLKKKIATKLDEDFRIRRTIIEDNNDVYEKLSDGFNSRIYFRLLTGEEKNRGIYIIDQPEDHISQKAIKDEVLEQFRRMAKKRQIIMVTHNPQFIVNLDVDNVIYLQDNQGELEIYSGALEYEDAESNILKIVADNIDGGLLTIKQRMRRYEKNI